MSRIIIVIITFFSLLTCNSPESITSGKKVLIYTRNGEGYIHENIEASVQALEEICEELNLGVMVSNDSSLFTPENLEQFDGIIFSNTNNEAFTSDGQRKAFQEFIRSGKGFAGIHSACGSERDWPWFWNMLGGKFLRHPPYQPFHIKVIDKNHISTAHLPDPWQWEDECYYIHHLNPDIHVLLAADLTTIEDEYRDEYPGTIFGDLFPLAWCHSFEGGKQWYTALGHDPEHYQDPLFRDHLKGGIQWILEIKTISNPSK